MSRGGANKRIIIINNEEWTTRKLSKSLNIAETTASRRLRRYEEQKITQQQLFAPRGYQNVNIIHGEIYTIEKLMQQVPGLSYDAANSRLLKYFYKRISRKDLFAPPLRVKNAIQIGGQLITADILCEIIPQITRSSILRRLKKYKDKQITKEQLFAKAGVNCAKSEAEIHEELRRKKNFKNLQKEAQIEENARQRLRQRGYL